MKRKNTLCIALGILACASSCKNASKPAVNESSSTPVIMTETVSYKADTANMIGYIAYDTMSKAKRPIVLVVHEWWGINDYTKRRARQLAELGYLAFAVDMFGNAAQGTDPVAAEGLAKPLYGDPAMAKARFDAALAKAKTFPVADTSQVLAIGYCFGGGMVLNMAKMGDDLDGVVSFHGSLAGVPVDKSKLKAKLLVCHGEDEQFVSAADVSAFKRQMDSIGADYTFKSYPGATHAFSNPDATPNGKKFKMPIAYNGKADTASWNDMKAFFDRIVKK